MIKTMYTKGKFFFKLSFASESLVIVGCKLVQFVVYCVLFVVMSTNNEKNSAVSEEGHVLTAYGFFLVVSLASMAMYCHVLPCIAMYYHV